MNNAGTMFTKLMTSMNRCVSRMQHARTVIKRCYSEKKYSDLKRMLEEKSRFHKDLSAPEDVLLFSYGKTGLKYTLIVAGGYTAMLMLLNSAHTVHISWNTRRDVGSNKKRNWATFGSNPMVKYAIIAVMIIGGIAIGFLANLYVGKCVKTITLLRGGTSVNIETFRGFGKTKIRKVDLENLTSSWSSRDGEPIETYMVLVKGDKMSYSLDMREGKILDKDTFYNTVGVKRAFKR